MQITTVSDIITKKVLNENTGELESQSYKQIRKRKKIRGGFRMVYKTYDDAVLEVVKSKKDLEILIYIRDLFTYNRVENVLSKVDIAKALKVSEQKASVVIRRLLDSNLIKKVSRGIYRLNPYMYLPFRSDAENLQQEWNNIKN